VAVRRIEERHTCRPETGGFAVIRSRDDAGVCRPVEAALGACMCLVLSWTCGAAIGAGKVAALLAGHLSSWDIRGIGS
jgi:hypothetical protein